MWLEAHELPAAEHLRTTAEILFGPPTPGEREARRREKDAAAAERGAVQDAVDAADATTFRAKMNGAPAHNPLAEAAAEPFRDREAAARRRAAIEALRPLGLADVITGGTSGAVLDVHLGILEREPDLAARAAMDRQWESGRAEREYADRRRAVDQYRENLGARIRARGWSR
jgi:hypothetical protein